MPRVRTAPGGKTFLHEVHLMGRTQAAIGRITGKGGFYSTFAQWGRSLECKAYRCIRWRNTMDQPAFDLTHRANRAAAHRVGAGAGVARRAARTASRLLIRLVVSLTVWVAGGIVLLPVNAQAQEAGGPIVIPGPGEKNPAALADLAEHMQAAPVKRTGSAATLGCRHRAVADAEFHGARRRFIHARRQCERLDRHSGRGRTAGRAANDPHQLQARRQRCRDDSRAGQCQCQCRGRRRKSQRRAGFASGGSGRGDACAAGEWRTASRGRSAGGRQCAAQRSRWGLRGGRIR